MYGSHATNTNLQPEARRRRPGGNDPRSEERKHRMGRPGGRPSIPALAGFTRHAGSMSGLRPDTLDQEIIRD
jgi:hypothetical protein